MTFRPATHADRDAIAAYLSAHIQTSMFPLSNLFEYGLGSTAERGMRFFLKDGPDGLTGVYGEANGRVAMPQVPDATAQDWADLKRLGCGTDLVGAMGEAGQVRALLKAWGYDTRRAIHDADEPGFTLELKDLVVPETPVGSTIVPLADIDRNLIISWRKAYHVETLGTPKREAQRAAAADIENYAGRGNHRVLMVDGKPVAMTGFNAVVGDTVQIGGVFTPAKARGRGLARRALALHLQEARVEGKVRAVLFSASDAASRVYTSIGFQPAGHFALVLFEVPGAKS